MAENSKIEWTDHTANFWWGCVHVSALCDHCYADALDARYAGAANSHFGAEARRRFIKSVWSDLPRWNEKARLAGKPARVFVMSMGDFFETLPETHPDATQMQKMRVEAMRLMESLTHLEFLVLTKRVSNVKKLALFSWIDGGWPANVRIGISVGTQQDADRDIPRLLELPCPNFLSMEPLLAPVTLRSSPQGALATTVRTWLEYTQRVKDGKFNPATYNRIHWVITGGESGPNARPSHPDWFRSLRDECQAAKVPFLFKQWGSWSEAAYPNLGKCNAGKQICFRADGHKQWIPSAYGMATMENVGKQSAGRLLDGRTWDEMPQPLQSIGLTGGAA